VRARLSRLGLAAALLGAAPIARAQDFDPSGRHRPVPRPSPAHDGAPPDAVITRPGELLAHLDNW